MAETIVPMPRNGLDFRIRQPSVAGTPMVPAPSSFPGLLPPPEPAAPAPPRTNELLQLSESLAELNPSLRQFGLSAVRKFAADAETDSKLAFAQLSPEQIAKVNRMSQDEIVKTGILPSGALPSFYVNVQKLAAENEVNQKYQQFILENYWQELSNPLSTKEIPEVLAEAQTKFFEGWGNESAFGRLSGKNEAERMDRQLANNAFQSRFSKRQERLEEESGIAGSRVLFESLNPELPPEARIGNIVGFLDGEYKRGNTKAADNFIKKSVQPYINRVTAENPDLARQYLTFLERVELPTGATLGEIGFANFQAMYRDVDSRQLTQSRRGVMDLQDKKVAIQDQVSLFFSEYSEAFKPDTWTPETKSDIKKKLLEMDLVAIPQDDGSLGNFSLVEDRHLHGYLSDVISKYYDDYKKDVVQPDQSVIQDLTALYQEGDTEGFMERYRMASSAGLLGNQEARMLKMGQDLQAGTALFRSQAVGSSKSNIRGAFTKYFANNATLDSDFLQTLQAETNAEVNPLFNRKLRQRYAEAKQLEENKNKPLPVLLDEILPALENEVIQDLQNKVESKNKEFITQQDKKKQQEEKAKGGQTRDGSMPSLPSAFGFSKGDDIAHGESVLPLNYAQKLSDRISFIQANFEKIGLRDTSALSPEDQKVYSGWLKIRKEELEKLDTALGSQRILLAKDLILKAFPSTKGGLADKPYTPEQLMERTSRYWKVVEMDGLSPEEIISGKTDEKIPLPLTDPVSSIRILTPHFRDTNELNNLVAIGKTSDNSVIEQMFLSLGIDPQNQAQVDQYLMDQRRLLYLRGR